MFAVRSLIAALRRNSVPRSAYDRGRAAFDAGRHDEALAAFAEAAGTSTGTGRALAENKRGVVLAALGRDAEALAAFCDALDADERCAPALVNVGNILLEAGHAEDAIDYYEAALRADDGYHGAHRNLAVAYKRLGRRAAAVRSLRTADRRAARQPLERG